MRRHVIALSVALILGSWPQESTGGQTVTLKIEVSMPDGAVFYIPAIGDGEVFGIVPLLKGRFAGIRITPRLRTDLVQIDVSALTATNKKLSEATCDEVRSWNSEDAGSYEGKENASLLLSGLAPLDLPVFKVKVVRAGGGRRRGASITRTPILLPSVDANITAPDPSTTLMGVLLAEWRGWCLILTLENACGLSDVVTVAGPPSRQSVQKPYVNCRCQITEASRADGSAREHSSAQRCQSRA